MEQMNTNERSWGGDAERERERELNTWINEQISRWWSHPSALQRMSNCASKASLLESSMTSMHCLDPRLLWWNPKMQQVFADDHWHLSNLISELATAQSCIAVASMGTLFSSHSSHSQLRVNEFSAVRPLCPSLWSWTCKSSPLFLGFCEFAHHDITCWRFG